MAAAADLDRSGETLPTTREEPSVRVRIIRQSTGSRLDRPTGPLRRAPQRRASPRPLRGSRPIRRAAPRERPGPVRVLVASRRCTSGRPSSCSSSTAACRADDPARTSRLRTASPTPSPGSRINGRCSPSGRRSWSCSPHFDWSWPAVRTHLASECLEPRRHRDTESEGRTTRCPVRSSERPSKFIGRWGPACWSRRTRNVCVTS